MYHSEGERRIAEFLERAHIHYSYQSGVLVNDREYQRIWYPDFRLPKYSLCIEYFGIENDPYYDQRTKHKLDAYRKNGIDVIPLYPANLRGDFGSYIFKRIYQTLDRRLSDLEEKIAQYRGQGTFSNHPILGLYSGSRKGYR